jgi:hypothetical protein
VSAAGIIQLIRFLTSLRTDSDTSSTTDTPHTITFDFRDREGY